MVLGLSNSYYLVDPLDYELTDIGKLFQCVRENEPCQEVSKVGYYVVDETRSYSCQESGVGLECSKIKTVATCNVATDIGKVVYANGKFSICLAISGEDKISVDLGSNSDGDYLLGKNEDANIFGMGESDDYAIVTISDKVVTLNSTCKYIKKIKYKNKYKD